MQASPVTELFDITTQITPSNRKLPETQWETEETFQSQRILLEPRLTPSAYADGYNKMSNELGTNSKQGKAMWKTTSQCQKGLQFLCYFCTFSCILSCNCGIKQYEMRFRRNDDIEPFLFVVVGLMAFYKCTIVVEFETLSYVIFL